MTSESHSPVFTRPDKSSTRNLNQPQHIIRQNPSPALYYNPLHKDSFVTAPAGRTTSSSGSSAPDPALASTRLFSTAPTYPHTRKPSNTNMARGFVTEGLLADEGTTIAKQLQRSMSAPPVAEHVGNLPPPMYAESEFSENQRDTLLHPDYYHYYAPRSHNPRLPVEYKTWESMYRSYQEGTIRYPDSSGQLEQVATTRSNLDRISERSDGIEAPSASVAESQAAFEAAVHAAGGHALRNGEPSPFEETSNADLSRKSLIDRIQEDFPRTPSPVYGTMAPPGMEASLQQYGGLDDSLSEAAAVPNYRERKGSAEVDPHPQHDPGFRGENAYTPKTYARDSRYARIPHGQPHSQSAAMLHPSGSSADPHFARHSSYGGPPENHLMMRRVSSGDYHYAYPEDHNAPPHDPYYPGHFVYYNSPPAYFRDPQGRGGIYEYQFVDSSATHQSHDGRYRQSASAKPYFGREPRAIHESRHSAYPRQNQVDYPVRAHQQASKSISSSSSHTNRGLVDDFRSLNIKRSIADLKDIAGHVIEYSKDQHGSRFIQQKLESASEEEKQQIFDEIYPSSYTLMTDVFGNYVIQKFFDYGTAGQKRLLGEKLVGNVLELALQMYGCRVVQKALEVIDTDQKIQLIAELKGQVMKCVKDQNGNHVIQKCIEMVNWANKKTGHNEPLDAANADFIVGAFAGNVATLATHPYGCRVIQRVLEHCCEKLTAPVLNEIQECCFDLVKDQYGNYVVQHVLEHGRSKERADMIESLRPEIMKLSQHKFASNVVEKCLTYATTEQRHSIIRDILTEDDSPVSQLQVMMKDPYANYVIQKLIDVADAEERGTMVARIKSQAVQLKRFTYGKHILARLEKLTGESLT